VFGVRPGSPLLFTVPATGERPLTFSVEALPEGVQFDAKTGRLTGVIRKQGEYRVTLTARNAKGEARRELRLVVGPRIALTPPMGWNSWNCWGRNVDAAKISAAAKAMAESGLINHGWTYITVDDAWQGTRTGPDHALVGNASFADMKALADYVHGLGLKFGLYSTPWKNSYAGFPGGSSDTAEGTPPGKDRHFGRIPFCMQDAREWAGWGVDYLKYDWHPIDPDHTRQMSEALIASGRDIVLSLSNGAAIANAEQLAKLANLWRTTGDIRDSWKSMSGIGFSQSQWAPFAGPGHWNDPDMLVVGYVGWGKPRPSGLTADEQYTHISLWCLLSSPLMLGCDMSKLDDFTMGLLTNDEVLELDQDPLGKQATRVAAAGEHEVWAKDMADGSKAVGLFNREQAPAKVTAEWSALAVKGPQKARDLWRQKDLGVFDGKYEATVPGHGVVLLRLWPQK
jgi:alpha-galactosidase